MLLLFETPAGFSLFKVKDEKKLDDVEVRVRNASDRWFFVSAAGGARELWFLRFDSIPLRVGFTWTRARRRARVVRDGGVSYGDTGDRGVRGYRGTVRSREEDRFDCREKGKARAREDGAGENRVVPIDRVWNETVGVRSGGGCIAKCFSF